MNISEHLTNIWKELHRYGTIVKDLNYSHYRLITYLYKDSLYVVKLECGMVTMIDITLLV